MRERKGAAKRVYIVLRGRGGEIRVSGREGFDEGREMRDLISAVHFDYNKYYF